MTPWMQIAGWVLVHFVWQGAALTLIAAVLLHACRRQSAAVRYFIACGTLGVMLLAAALTASLVRAARVDEANPQRVRVVLARQSPADIGVALPIHLDVRPAAPGLRAHVEGLFPSLVSAWLIGVIILGTRGALGWRKVRRLHQLGLSSPPSAWQAAAHRIAVRLGLNRAIRVVELPHVDVPFVIGCLRPIVVLPFAAMAHLNVMQVEAILAHELAHIRRHDYLVNLLQTVAETLFFYHPAIWWLSARIREEREHCCDDVAVEVCGDPVGYAEALTELETWRTGSAHLAPAATGGSLVSRIQRILRVEMSRQSQPSHSAIAIISTLALLATAAGFAQTSGQKMEFEVASVRPNVSGDARSGFGAEPGGRFNAVNMPLASLIRHAYQIQERQLVGAPQWMFDERYDITAKADKEFPATVPGGPPNPAMMMVRSLLADRFKLKMHSESRQFDIYSLVPVRHDGTLGSKLTRSMVDCAALAAAQRDNPPPPDAAPTSSCVFRVFPGYVAAAGSTMSRLAVALTSFAGRLVVDRTNLAGSFDFELKWTPDQLPLRAPGTPADRPIRFNGVEIPMDGPSLFTAIQEQLGLKLDPARGPVEVLVIDHVERPTPE